MNAPGRFLKLWFPVVVWAGFIFYLSGIPSLETGLEYDFILRKIAHVGEYFILTFLVHRAFKGSCAMSPFGFFIGPAMISFLYAASDEFHQSMVSGRHGCVPDVLIDGIGILVFYIVIKLAALNRFKGPA